MIRIIVFMLVIMLTGQARAIQIKIATISPEGSVWMEKMREGAEVLARKTNNRVEIKFYSGGVMGDDQAVLRKIRIGQLQGGARPDAEHVPRRRGSGSRAAGSA